MGQKFSKKWVNIQSKRTPVRGETFVTRKITMAAARIALGLQDKLYLGNLNSKRDWGHARDYVKMMWLILQAEKPEDWIIATGKTTSVREFARMAFNELGIELEFKGTGTNEIGIIKSIDEEKYNQAIQPSIFDIQHSIGSTVIEVDERYFRPTEVDLLLGDAAKAKEKLAWEPEITLKETIKEMTENDLNEAYQELVLKKSGFKVPKSCGM